MPSAKKTALGQAYEALLKSDPLTGPILHPALPLCFMRAEFTLNSVVLPT